MTGNLASSSESVGASPKVTVIVVNWNTKELLDRCLRSLQADRSRLAIEVIVVDNGSADGSPALLAASYPWVAVIANRDNRGFSAANNQGISEAAGRYVFLLNSDTEVRPGSLRVLTEYADRHPEVAIFGPRLLNSDGTLQPSGGPLPTPWSTIATLLGLDRLMGRPAYGTRRDYTVPAVVDEVSGAAMMVRAEVLTDLRGLDEAFSWGYEDVDLCRRARDAGWQVHYVPDAVVIHEWGASRELAPAATVLKAIGGRRYYFAKHHGGAASALVVAATVLAHLLRWVVFALAGLLNERFQLRASTEWEIMTNLIGRQR